MLYNGTHLHDIDRSGGTGRLVLHSRMDLQEVDSVDLNAARH